MEVKGEAEGRLQSRGAGRGDRGAAGVVGVRHDSVMVSMLLPPICAPPCLTVPCTPPTPPPLLQCPASPWRTLRRACALRAAPCRTPTSASTRPLRRRCSRWAGVADYAWF